MTGQQVKSVSRKVKLRWALNAIAAHFERAGWRLAESPDSMLAMSQNPAPDVEHTLLVSEPYRPANLPSDNVLGLSCAVNVYFPELETAINKALGRDPTLQPRLSLSIGLCLLVPRDHVYAGNVHLVTVDGDVHSAVAPMIQDYETYLEPIRAQVSVTSVFLDADSRPAFFGRSWRWDLLRAAYCRLRADITVWQPLFAQFEARAKALLATETPNDPGRADVSTDLSTIEWKSNLHHALSAVERRSKLRGAEEMLKFIAAVR